MPHDQTQKGPLHGVETLQRAFHNGDKGAISTMTTIPQTSGESISPDPALQSGSANDHATSSAVALPTDQITSHPVTIYDLERMIHGLYSSVEDGNVFWFEQGALAVFGSAHNEMVWSREEFEAFVVAGRAFYDTMGDAIIEEYNSQSLERFERERRRFTSEPAPRRSGSREGYVYLLRLSDGYYKIGKAKDVQDRWRLIGTKMPQTVELLHTIPCEDYTAAERIFHDRYAKQRVNGEWFCLSDDEVATIKGVERITAEEIK